MIEKLSAEKFRNIETTKVLKKSIQANRALAKLNGTAKITPKQNILINSLVLQEAKGFSEIENIVITMKNQYSYASMLKKRKI